MQPKGPGSDKLLYAAVPVLEWNKCKDKYHQINVKLRQGEICYGFHEGTTTRDSCEVRRIINFQLYYLIHYFALIEKNYI